MEMIESYAQSFKNLLNQIPTWMMCEKVALCSKNKSVAVNQFSNSRCLEGSEYWCKSWDNAKTCKVILSNSIFSDNINCAQCCEAFDLI